MPVTDFGDYLCITFESVDQLKNHQLSDSLQKRILPFAATSLHNVEIVSAEKLTKGDNVKDVYDLALNVENIQFEYEPGDTIGILPNNDNQEVDQLLERLNVTSVANQPYLLSIIPNTTKKKAAIPPHIPVTGTLHEVFLRCVDIRSVPKKIFLSSLVRYTTEPHESELLQKLCSPGGSLQYNEFITQNRTLLNLLKAFPSCNLPVERLLENLPPLQPRPYSISSSGFSKQLKRELHIAFSVVNVDQTTKGICTGWLESCIKTKREAGSNLETLLSDLQIITKAMHVPIYFRKSNNFRLPTTPATPIIMIGPGTGIAPFVGFLEHRSLQPHIKFGTSWLFYSCRYNNKDFLYKSKIQRFQDDGTLTKLFVSFSRENDKKCYVQDLIRENKRDFVDVIRRQNGAIYVCGDAKNMLKEVKNAIITCLVDVEELSCVDAEMFVKEMEKTNRYVTDVWL